MDKDNPDSLTRSVSELIRFLLRNSGVFRSPVFIWVFLSSASRTGMIFLINKIAENGRPTLLLTLAVIAAAVVMLATSHWAKMAGVKLVQNLVQRMRLNVGRQLLNADVGFFQSSAQSEIFHAITGHTGNVAGTTLRLVNILQSLLLFIFCLGYLLLEMPLSVVATLVALVIGAGAFMATEGPARAADRRRHAAAVATHDTIRDILAGYKELRLRRSRRDDIEAEFAERSTEQRDRATEVERHFSYGQIGASASLALLLISIVVILPLITETDSVTLLQILTLLLFSFGPVEQMITGLPGVARAAVSFRVIRRLEEALEADAEPDAVRKVADNRPGFDKIELRGVTVVLTREIGEGDNSATDRFQLGPIDLTLDPGQSVFITGGNGMGKSTLMQLLTGLRHPDAGEILIDGKPVTRESVGDYRGAFSAVFSEFHLFRNLYGLSQEEKDRLRKYVNEMGLADGVAFDDDRFANLALSTGQKRRLALCIALAEQRPILVLDEFAADQDPERRAFFYDVLVPRLAARGHCVIAVTHDEHCFGKADRLIKMADGKIVEDRMNRETSAAS